MVPVVALHSREPAFVVIAEMKVAWRLTIFLAVLLNQLLRVALLTLLRRLLIRRRRLSSRRWLRRGVVFSATPFRFLLRNHGDVFVVLTRVRRLWKLRFE